MDPQDCFELGYNYFHGIGADQDYALAAIWYHRAAEQGNAAAENNLGYCYMCGLGVEQSNNEAIYWYQKAAGQGEASAKCNLGYCYENGLGISRDYDEAVRLYREAAAQGFATAQNNLGECYASGHGVKQNYSEAVKWYRKAADQGLSTAQFNLALNYEEGNGVGKNYEKAIKLYQKAADQGYVDARNRLIDLAKQGYAVDLGGSMDFDNMDGYQFESFCVGLLLKNGFTDVEQTQASSDQGVDVIAVRDGVRFGIQCKHYSSPVGNKAIQEVCAGKAYYHCNVAVILTNNYFTQSAEELARVNDVVLWDRNKLFEFIENTT